MIGSKNQKPKDKIISLLLEGPKSGKRIKSQLDKLGHSVSIQMIYKQLKELVDDEIVLKQKQLFFINNEWIKNVSNILNIQDIDLPESGEKFTYKFNSLENLDAHWKHVTEAFNKILPNEPMFLYSYHQFWIYTPNREESERRFAGEFLHKKQHTFYVIGGVTDLDKKYRNSFKDEYYKVENFSIKSLKEKEHLLIMGNFIINVKVPDVVTQEINQIYKNDKTIIEKEGSLRLLLSKNHKSLFTIENNEKKAKQIKRKIAPPFVLPEHVKEKIK